MAFTKQCNTEKTKLSRKRRDPSLGAPQLKLLVSNLESLSIVAIAPNLKFHQKQFQAAAHHPQCHSQVYHVHAAPLEGGGADVAQLEDGAWSLLLWIGLL